MNRLNSLIKVMLLATFVTLVGCSESTAPSYTEATNYPFQQAPPVNAFALAGEAGCGSETHLLLDNQGQVQGVANIIHSPSYLFIDVIPTPPWLITFAAAEAWSNPPTTTEPSTFTAQRLFNPAVDSAALWLPMPQAVLNYEQRNAYIAILANTESNGQSSQIASLDNGNTYVNFSTCVYAPIYDPDPSTFMDPSSSSESDPMTESSSSSESVENPSSDSSEPTSSDSSTNPSSDSHWNLCGKIADGRTIGFWKNNLTKFIAGITKGIQIQPTDMEVYLLEWNISAPEALALLQSTSSDPNDLLAKQLMGSKMNVARGAYIDDSETYTRELVEWAESLLSSEEASSDEILAAKDLLDAYNNSHGGAIGMNCSLE